MSIVDTAYSGCLMSTPELRRTDVFWNVCVVVGYRMQKSLAVVPHKQLYELYKQMTINNLNINLPGFIGRFPTGWDRPKPKEAV